MKSLSERPPQNYRCCSSRIFCCTQSHLLKKKLNFLISGIIVLVNLTGCGPPSLDARSMQALFEDRKQPVFDNYAVDDRLIYYAEVRSPQKLLIVFLHGTPGSWYDWAQYMADENLSANTHLIAVDRPGFGLSAAKGVVLSLEKQAEYLWPIFERNSSGREFYLSGIHWGPALRFAWRCNIPNSCADWCWLPPPWILIWKNLAGTIYLRHLP